MKDNFSAQAALYAVFRPKYPQILYHHLYTLVTNFDTALDIATGNGQVAVALASKFGEVHATDISARQLEHAPKLSNIFYKVEPAEKTGFTDAYFDMVTVAQAIHWFRFDEFYKEVKRVLKPGGILAVIGYGVLTINEQIDAWLHHFYRDVTGPYWDKERTYVDEAYKTIPFPFAEIATPAFAMEYEWNRDQFIGYLGTWSAVQHYMKANGVHPLTDELIEQLILLWPDNVTHTVKFPLFLRVGNNNN